MQAVVSWMAAHWVLVSLAAVALISVINAATKHWSSHTGLVAVLLRISELLSYFTSKDVPGWFKWPLTSVPPAPPTPPRSGGNPLLLWLAVASSLTLAGSACGTWQQSLKVGLDSAGEAAAGVRPLIEAHYAAKCEAVARSCAAAKTPDCPLLVACQAARKQAEAPLQAVHVARVLGYSAIAASDKGAATTSAAKASQVLADALAALHAGGVL